MKNALPTAGIAKTFAVLLFLFTILILQTNAVYAFDDEWEKEVYGSEPIELNTSDISGRTKSFRNFYGIVSEIFIKRGWKKEDLCDERDAISRRIMSEYGSVFVVAEGATPPPVCMFTSNEQVENFQKKAGYVSAEIAGTKIELQSAAMQALIEARTEALKKGLNITPRDGSEAARRNYNDTIRLWNSRFEPACEHWKNLGKLTSEQIEKLKSLPVKEQVREVLELEKKGIYFNKFFNNSILYSVAAPGASQHLSMLALDINEYENEEVRNILAKYGWFQTVRNDLPHFTFLGHKQTFLENLGLKQVAGTDRKFWVPNI